MSAYSVLGDTSPAVILTTSAVMAMSLSMDSRSRAICAVNRRS